MPMPVCVCELLGYFKIGSLYSAKASFNETHYIVNVAQADLKLILLQPSKWWDYRHKLLCPATVFLGFGFGFVFSAENQKILEG